MRRTGIHCPKCGGLSSPDSFNRQMGMCNGCAKIHAGDPNKAERPLDLPDFVRCAGSCGRCFSPEDRRITKIGESYWCGPCKTQRGLVALDLDEPSDRRPSGFPSPFRAKLGAMASRFL